MKFITKTLLAAFMVLLFAGLSMAESTPTSLKVTNTTSGTIKIDLSVDDGSGDGSVTLALGASHTFKIENTAYYLKPVTHDNRITICTALENGQEGWAVSKVYFMAIRNEVGLMSLRDLKSNEFTEVESYSKCVVNTTTSDDGDHTASNTLTVEECDVPTGPSGLSAE
jgi:hypothetical protein